MVGEIVNATLEATSNITDQCSVTPSRGYAADAAFHNRMDTKVKLMNTVYA